MSDQPNVTVEWEPPQQVSVHWPPPDTSYESMVPPEKPHGKWACICRLGGVGDNLVAASVLRPLKRLGYMNEFISEDPQYIVLENNPFLDKLSVKHGAADIPQHDMHLWQKWFDMRSREYDFLPNGSRA